jgi:hypothetical protein
MARKVEQFPAAADQSKYPWEDWLDGDIWELTQGKDFKGRATTFRSNARSQAKRRGGKLRARILRSEGNIERIYLQFHRGK